MTHATATEEQTRPLYNARKEAAELCADLPSDLVGAADRIMRENFEKYSMQAEILLKLLDRNPGRATMILAHVFANYCLKDGKENTALSALGLTNAQFDYWREEISGELDFFKDGLANKPCLEGVAATCWVHLQEVSEPRARIVWLVEMIRTFGHYASVNMPPTDATRLEAFTEDRSDLIGELMAASQQNIKGHRMVVFANRLASEAGLDEGQTNSLMDLACIMGLPVATIAVEVIEVGHEDPKAE